VVAVLRLDGLRELTLVELERDLVELGNGLAARDRQLAPCVLAAGVGRARLRERREVASALELGVDVIRFGLARFEVDLAVRVLLGDEDVADVA